MRKSTSSLSLALTALAVALALAACASGSARAAEDTNGVQVTVLLYSGRPNPTFTLTAEQADRVRQLVAAAQPDPGFRGGSVLPSILGYNGVLVEGLPAPLAVYGGRIEVQDREGKRVVSDGGALESFLLEAAAQNKTLSAEQLRFIQTSRDKQQS
ncbi:MAG TPA: hypothetical protein VNM67_03945 [Thermoanaerobaculia bacterium]|jgi:hypothetical protein|nr:hypothetical protein [Thermoanaerobaculia bacterium]